MGSLLEEVKKVIKGAKADFAKVMSPLALLHFILNGFFNEYQKWFGHKTWIWNFMYWACDYRKKMLDPSQQARYLRIKELLEQHCPKKAAVLDVGCGTANGLSIWREAGLGSFEGIDIAAAAIEEARETYGGKPDLPARFEAVSMQAYDSGGRTFDAVIFNESLYYVSSEQDAVEMAKKALTLLKEGGHLIISMSETHHAEKIWAALDFLPPPKSRGRAEAVEGNTWQVAAFEKKEVQPAGQ
uniref:Methyltransferase domain-containing protein n=1 Tax=Alexandrium catenella TaxID=2925 RepID=A0A7S1R8D8_ALECA